MMFNRLELQRRVAVLILVLLGACSHAWAKEASVILLNGKVWTVNPAEPVAQAVALDGNTILAVGSNDEIRKLAGPATRTIDLAGRLLLPGFNDAHVHFLPGGESLIAVQLRESTSQADFRDRIARYAKTIPDGAWISGGAWDHQNWHPPILPDRELIDVACDGHPAFLLRIDGHMALANTLALKLAGIGRDTPNPPGGQIDRDKDGNPTGVLRDAATALVERVIPLPTPQEEDRAMQAALREAARHGVTSVQNMANSADDTTQRANFREFQKFAREGKLTVRIYESMPLRDWKTLADLGVVAPFGNASLRLGNLKEFADGALGSETAWMDAPFANHPGYSGISSADLQRPDEFYAMLQGADKAGLQISIHAIGDRANRTILDMYAHLEHDDGPADRRLRIEHAQHLHAADIPRFGQLHVIASMQPYHAIDDGRWAETLLGPQRIQTSYAWRSLLDAGVTLAFGSDWPVAPLDPVMGIYAAATRRTLDGKNPNGWVPAQRISVAEAVHAYTMGSAFAEHQENVKGSIQPGKLADLVVLNDDIFTIPPAAIEHTKVDLTLFDGNIVYERK